MPCIPAASLGDVLVRMLSHPRLHPSHLCSRSAAVVEDTGHGDRSKKDKPRETAADPAPQEDHPRFLHWTPLPRCANILS